jgi:hypothetical protein
MIEWHIKNGGSEGVRNIRARLKYESETNMISACYYHHFSFLPSSIIFLFFPRSPFFSHHSFTSYRFLLPDTIGKSEKERVTTIRGIKWRRLHKNRFFFLSSLSLVFLRYTIKPNQHLLSFFTNVNKVT